MSADNFSASRREDDPRELSTNPKQPRTRISAEGHKLYSCLLRGVRIDGPNKVWRADITCIYRTGEGLSIPGGDHLLVERKVVPAWQPSIR